jgi:hypothetical protein
VSGILYGNTIITISVTSTGLYTIIPNSPSNIFYGSGHGVWSVSVNGVAVGGAYCIIALNQAAFIGSSMIFNSSSLGSMSIVSNYYGLNLNITGSSAYGTYYVNIIRFA